MLSEDRAVMGCVPSLPRECTCRGDVQVAWMSPFCCFGFRRHQVRDKFLHAQVGILAEGRYDQCHRLWTRSVCDPVVFGLDSGGYYHQFQTTIARNTRKLNYCFNTVINFGVVPGRCGKAALWMYAPELEEKEGVESIVLISADVDMGERWFVFALVSEVNVGTIEIFAPNPTEMARLQAGIDADA
eukprot:TRINITY_DN3854_c0_g1_i2.p1 TRINITY_DN3854_c0_g1~~TRINITY_DN3854_c0_g1_i2.p1  ORF type:complete len:186 (-),score=21.55 TRINITY_DN3854_c0_g1_i2:319-876(-)